MPTFNDFYRLLLANGWHREEGGRHALFVKGKQKIPVGRHGAKEIPNGTYRAMLKQAGIDPNHPKRKK